jgi:ABC-type multidrug transport system fused ATPase/permease subunit
MDLPDTYDTIVGEQGSLFSGGQRQRLSIARALIRNPEIVILDEATSSLDPESSDELISAFETLSEGRTVITVTHRLVSALTSDKIIVLDRGRIIGTGKHEDLLQSCDVYKTMAEQQKLTTDTYTGNRGVPEMTHNSEET